MVRVWKSRCKHNLSNTWAIPAHSPAGTVYHGTGIFLVFFAVARYTVSIK